MKSFNNGVEYLNRLKTIFSLLMVAPLILSIGGYLKYQRDITPIVPLDPTSWLLVILIGLIALLPMILVIVWFNKQARLTRKMEQLRDKLNYIAFSSYVLWGVMLFGSLVASTTYFLTGYVPYGAIYVFTLIMFSMQHPTIHHIKRLIGKKNEEEQLMLDENTPIP